MAINNSMSIKISELPSVSLPYTGNELIPFVDGGVTSQGSLNTLTDYLSGQLVANSPSWNNTYTSYSANSANWNNTYTSYSSNSANWQGIYNTLSPTPSAWLYTNLGSLSCNMSVVTPGTSISTTGTGSTIYTTGATSHIYTVSGNIYSNYGNIRAVRGDIYATSGNIYASGPASRIYANSDINSVFGDVYAAGNIGSGSSLSPEFRLDINGDTMNLRSNRTISLSGQTGVQGEVCFDNEFIYRCVSTNNWKRSPISTWTGTGGTGDSIFRESLCTNLASLSCGINVYNPELDDGSGGPYNYITVRGYGGTISTIGEAGQIATGGLAAPIYTTGQSSPLFTQNTDSSIHTLGSTSPIFTSESSSQIYTKGSDSHIIAADSTSFVGIGLGFEGPGFENVLPTVPLDIGGSIIRVRTTNTPSGSSYAGNIGEICFDDNYMYRYCDGTPTRWKRIPWQEMP